MTQSNLFGWNETQRVIDKLGFLPGTIWRVDEQKQRRWKEMIADPAERTVDTDVYATTVDGGGASIFSPVLAAMLLTAYAPDNAAVFDPFAGGGTRAIVAGALGHTYYGLELRGDECRRIAARLSELRLPGNVFEADAMSYDDLPMAFAHFCYTCAPYWNLEQYGGDPQLDLSMAPTYAMYLGMLNRAAKQTRRRMKSGALTCWTFGDLRDNKGNLILLHADAAKVIAGAGYDIHDIIIWDGYGTSWVQRAGNFEGNKRLIRQHEYVLVMRVW